MRRLIGGLVALTLMAWLAFGSIPVTRADQAPFWESPTGLAPGGPGLQVRMAAETVDIQVVERGDEIHALVKASFSMANDGPTAQMKVGFPATTVSLFDELAAPDANGRRFADAPGTFSRQALREFQVSVGGQPVESSWQKVPAAADAGYGADWLMWEMAFPQGQTTVVDVSYEQVLTERPGQRVVQPMYVLRTGALWAGSIGEATVMIRAADGGALIGGPELFVGLDGRGGTATYPRAEQVYGAADAVEVSPTQLVWRFRDLEPTRDVGSTYVRSSAWRAYTNADLALAGSGFSDVRLLREVASTALDILGGPTPCGSGEDMVCLNGPHRVPRGLVDLLAQPDRERARRALELAPDDPDALLTFGDFEWWFAMPLQKHHGELRCWPSAGVDAYERAKSAGAGGALPRLLGLRASARQVRMYGGAVIQTCSGEPDRRLDAEMVKATVEEGNRAWSYAVGRGGDASLYPNLFAGAWLDARTAEVQELRRNRQYRVAQLKQLDFGDLSFADDATASVETTEVWDDKTYAENGAVVRDASGRLRQRYELRKLDGLWKIVDGVILRG